jgi:hypothetical protein
MSFIYIRNRTGPNTLPYGTPDATSTFFAKAFDKVSHPRLLHKLEHYGIHGNNKNWIKSFLNNRTQAVALENTISDNVDVMTLHLSPLNAIFHFPSHLISLFRSFCNKTWSSLVLICNNLSWNNHINNIVASANQAQGMLRRNIKKAPQHTKAMAVNTNNFQMLVMHHVWMFLCWSCITYGCFFVGHASQMFLCCSCSGDVHDIIFIQNSFLVLIYSERRRMTKTCM